MSYYQILLVIMRWREIDLVLMEVMTILILMMNKMMMPKASLGCSFFILSFYYDF